MWKLLCESSNISFLEVTGLGSMRHSDENTSGYPLSFPLSPQTFMQTVGTGFSFTFPESI